MLIFGVLLTGALGTWVSLHRSSSTAASRWSRHK
jgi:hypothetical protein